jgi:hypothetical protein
MNLLAVGDGIQKNYKRLVLALIQEAIEIQQLIVLGDNGFEKLQLLWEKKLLSQIYELQVLL